MQKTIFSKLSIVPLLLGLVLVNAQDREGLKELKQFRQNNSSADGIERCGTIENEMSLKKMVPGRMSTEQFETWLAPLVEKAKRDHSLNKSQNGNIITIPVVVHVIHNGQNVGTAPNITDAQVKSQIAVMNNDYRRLAGSPGFNANPVGADVEIQFVLAKVDPKGNPTNGIDRVNLCKDYWARGAVSYGYEDFINGTVKPKTIWDPTKYMNMWSLEFAKNGLLGYAQFPSSSGLQGLEPDGGAATSDGVVAGYSTFGSMDYNDGTFLMIAGYDRGRTMTHEVGHYLGLRHIWGDASCGNDYCADTPTAHTANYDCDPAIASCDDPSVFEMVQNYMDYTNDTCMNIFTSDQKTRIRTVMDNSPRRMELKASTADQPIPLFQNDAEIKYDGGCSLGIVNCGAGVLRLLITNRGTGNLTSASISYSFNGGAAQNYNWTGNLTQDQSSVINIPVDGSVASSPVSFSIVTVNGGADQRSTNNTSTGNYVKPVAPEYFPATSVTFTLKRDRYGVETRWNLKNSAGQIVKSGAYSNTKPGQPDPALITQTWTLPADCYAFTISDDFGDGLENGYVDIATSSGQVIFHKDGEFVYETKTFTTRETLGTQETNKKSNFGVYPNPANDVLNITAVSGETQFEIHNAVGQIVKKGKIDNNQVRVADLEKGVYVITIQNKNISESIKFVKK
ncbi:T9SS type A sorting domain-containing protein [Chryseobacterium capnotolerans]|uniref:M43 family zinc metalloprotease n=1 Tax=Chryseobacterium TaxID=59732 RepID=UPI00083B89EC|nr:MULTISPECIES: M43 family zinc metalloprotease [Chryseobacterium]UHO37665.1 T9SS type A sorting domain-containing protein [Chryseobacterium capnotolerans]